MTTIRHLHRHVVFGLLAAAAAMPLSAQSFTSGSVNVGGLTVELIDLAPHDGIAPSIAFWNSSRGEYDTTLSWSGERALLLNQGVAGFGGVGGWSPDYAAASALSSAPVPAGRNIGEAQRACVQPTSGCHWFSQSFLLSAQTAIVVSGDYQLSAQADAALLKTLATPLAATASSLTLDATSQSLLFATLKGYTPGGPTEHTASDSKTASSKWVYEPRGRGELLDAPAHETSSGSFAVRLDNPLNSGLNTEFTLTGLSLSTVYGSYWVQTVPEPGSLALSSLALAGMGVAYRRARRHGGAENVSQG